jgi:hypothetical protein
LDEIGKTERELKEIEEAVSYMQTTRQMRPIYAQAPSQPLIDHMTLRAPATKESAEDRTKLLGASRIGIESFDDASAAMVMNRKLDSLAKEGDSLNQRLTQLEFDLPGCNYRVEGPFPGAGPDVRSANWRFLYMVVAPLGAIWLLFGLFFVLPKKIGPIAPASAGRPADTGDRRS